VAGQARDLDQVPQAPLGFRVFGQAAGDGLDQARNWQGERIVAAAMPEAAFVGEEGGFHRSRLLQVRRQ